MKAGLVSHLIELIAEERVKRAALQEQLDVIDKRIAALEFTKLIEEEDELQKSPMKLEYLVEEAMQAGDKVTFTKNGKVHKSKEGEDVHFITDRGYAAGEYIVALIISEA